MSKKTWLYIAVGAGVLLVAYLIFRPAGSSLLGKGVPATSGTAGIIDASGRAAGGFANLWKAIFGDASQDTGTESGSESDYIDTGV